MSGNYSNYTAIDTDFDGKYIAPAEGAKRVGVTDINNNINTFEKDYNNKWNQAGLYKYNFREQGDLTELVSSYDGDRLALSVENGYIYTIETNAWNGRSEGIVNDGNNLWTSVACSSEGSKIAACAESGYIYTSEDGGKNWIQRYYDSASYFQSITSASDGMILAVAANVGNIYVSSNGGENWTATSVGSKDWISISSASDGTIAGTIFVACEENGYLYTSIDGGELWIQDENLQSEPIKWTSVTISSDGKRVAICGLDQYIYTGKNFDIKNGGWTWTRQNTLEKKNWSSIVTTSDGNQIIACVGDDGNNENDYGYIYTGIYDEEDDIWEWAERKPTSEAQKWKAISTSSDGQKLACVSNGKVSGQSVQGGYIYTSIDGGATWIEQTTASKRFWNSIASSSDGARLVSCVPTELIWTYSYGGSTWNQQGDRNYWFGIAASEDCLKLVAGAYNDYIYTSTNGGYDWIRQPKSGQRNWTCVCSDANGNKLVACVNNNGSAGTVYTSINSGVDWDEKDGPYDEQAGRYATLASITSDSTGQYLASCDDSGYIYTSDNFGDSWKKRAINAYWYSITSDITGKYLAAVDNGFDTTETGNIWTSTDFGVNWIKRTNAGSRKWDSIASDYSGSKLVACVENGFIYTSTDYGINWTQRDIERDWNHVSSSDDGVVLAACVKDGYIYTSLDSGVSWTEQLPAGLRKWSGVVSSSFGGAKVVACTDTGAPNPPGFIYQFINRLYESSASGVRDWQSVAVSPDVSILAAVTSIVPSDPTSGYIWTSDNSGNTWNQRATQQNWSSIALSEDGKKLAAVVENGYLYTNNNYGIGDWIPNENLGVKNWTSITSDANGNNLAACAGNDYIYISNDGGIVWKPNTDLGIKNWTSIKSSNITGQFLAAVASEDGLYTSIDFGETWVKESDIIPVGVGLIPSGTSLFVTTQDKKILVSDQYVGEIFVESGSCNISFLHRGIIIKQFNGVYGVLDTRLLGVGGYALVVKIIYENLKHYSFPESIFDDIKYKLAAFFSAEAYAQAYTEIVYALTDKYTNGEITLEEYNVALEVAAKELADNFYVKCYFINLARIEAAMIRFRPILYNY